MKTYLELEEYDLRLIKEVEEKLNTKYTENNLVEQDSLISIIDDLLSTLKEVEEEFKDYKENEDDWKDFERDPYSYYGVSERDFH